MIDENVYRAQLGNQSRPFRSHQPKLCTVFPGGYSIMTSVPVFKKGYEATMYDRSMVTIERLNESTIFLSESVIRNCVQLPPGSYHTMTSAQVCEKVSFSKKRSIMEMQFLLINYRRMLSLFQNPPLRPVYSAP